MEQSEHLGNTTVPIVSSPTENTTSLNHQKSQRSALSHSEPCPTSASQQLDNDDSLTDSTNSVPTLRFPRPLGSRQLSNWISSSSPDIMQPGTTPDEDASLAELGYDIIGADGESQAPSIASSFDYTRPDDVHSLCGTDTGTDVDTNDVDTDSSDEEEEIILDDAGRAHTYAEIVGGSAHEDDLETPIARSLENPTSLLHHSDSFPELPKPNITSRVREQATEQITADQDGHYSSRSNSDDHKKRKQSTDFAPASWLWCYLIDNRRSVFLVLGLALTYACLSPFRHAEMPKTISTVPVASVQTVEASSSASVAIISSSSVVVQKSVQTTTSSTRSRSLQPVVADTPTASQLSSGSAEIICTAEIYAHDRIMVTVPSDVKASWLSKQAIMIAVSRDGKDIPNEVSVITRGFMIVLPPKEAHGVVEVSIITKRKPKIHEVYKVDFGQHVITDVLDVSKQLVKDLALYVANAVNGTTTWVQEVSAPAVDEGALLTQSLAEKAFSLQKQIFSELKHYTGKTMTKDELAIRAHQIKVEMKRASLDIRDDISLSLLTAQLSSKLWWLKLQGKLEEYQSYLDKAEAYYKAQAAKAFASKKTRGKQAKLEIRGQRGEVQQGPGSFWHWRRAE